jgi:hypothetical protein
MGNETLDVLVKHEKDVSLTDELVSLANQTLLSQEKLEEIVTLEAEALFDVQSLDKPSSVSPTLVGSYILHNGQELPVIEVGHRTNSSGGNFQKYVLDVVQDGIYSIESSDPKNRLALMVHSDFNRKIGIDSGKLSNLKLVPTRYLLIVNNVTQPYSLLVEKTA